jgi:hypothetical protein
MNASDLICGCQVQWDKSGIGHCWVNKPADDLPAETREEITAEISDGNKSCDDFIASNGQHYRWSAVSKLAAIRAALRAANCSPAHREQDDACRDIRHIGD